MFLMWLISGVTLDSAASMQELTANLFEFQKSGYLCDTVIVADDGQLKAHSVVLAAASPAFKLVLKSSDKPLQHTIVLPGMQLVVVSIVVQFIYTGEINEECGYSVKVMDAIKELGIKLHSSRYVTSSHYRVSQKSGPLIKLFKNIFTLVKSFCMKFCRFIANSYPHISTNFCGFILIFHQMALIFQRVPIIFTLSSFEYSPRK